MKKYDVIIVGGGLAGLTAAIHLSSKEHSVLLIEKKRYPHHKVCGEYVSNEVIPYLRQLGVSLKGIAVKPINNLLLSTFKGESLTTKLTLGGIGISRYTFDNLLYEKANHNGVDFKFETVTEVTFDHDLFEVTTEDGPSYTTTMVIGAYGKRSSLDKTLKRDFIQTKSSWLGVKAHYEYADFPEDQVALHNFKGGYGGLSKTETGAVNFCYLASYESFQKEKNIENFNTNVVARNPFLEDFLKNAKLIFDEPLTIAQISFHQKTAVEKHMLMCGDTAGLIHPLCGNGMAMAIHSAKIASEEINDYFRSKQRNRSQLERNYQEKWNTAFKKRLWTGRKLQALLLNEKLSGFAMNVAIRSPRLLQKLIKNTHGTEIGC